MQKTQKVDTAEEEELQLIELATSLSPKEELRVVRVQTNL